MRKSSIIILAVALTLIVAGFAVLVGSFFYARSNDITPLDAARRLADIQVGNESVYVGLGPLEVAVDDKEDRVSVRIGPFDLNVNDSGVTINGGGYERPRSWYWGAWGGSEPDYYDRPLKRVLEFDKLDRAVINLVSREIEVTQGSGAGSISLYERFEGEFSSFEVKDGYLGVSVNDRYTDIRGGFWNASNRLTGVEAKVILVLPAGYSEGIELENVSGGILLDGITSGSVNIESVSGEVTVRGCVFDETKLNTVSGGVEVLGTDFNLLEAQTVSSRLKLRLPQDENSYTFDFDSVSGSLELNGSSYRRGSRVGNGDVRVSIETVSGDATVTTQ